MLNGRLDPFLNGIRNSIARQIRLAPHVPDEFGTQSLNLAPSFNGLSPIIQKRWIDPPKPVEPEPSHHEDDEDRERAAANQCGTTGWGAWPDNEVTYVKNQPETNRAAPKGLAICETLHQP